MEPHTSKTSVLTLSNRLIIQNAPYPVVAEIERRLTIENPAWIENERMGRWNGDTEHYLKHYKRRESGRIAPRGFAGQAIALFKKHGAPYHLDDRRRTLRPVDFAFNGELRDYQHEAVTAMLRKDQGTLVMPTGAGKTVAGCALIAERKQPALWVTHTRELRNQAIERIEPLLGIPRDEIGVIGDGKRTIGDRVTVATVQTLAKIAQEVAPHIGFLIVDECHHTPSRTFTDVVTAFDCRYVLGLSATPYRRDGLGRLVFWYLGDVVHRIEKSGLVETGNVLPFEVITKETRFETYRNASEEYSTVLSELTEDAERNRLIVHEIVSNRQTPGISLVLSDRKSHCQTLQALLQRGGIDAEVLTGDRTPKERKEIVERLNAGRIRTLIGTTQLVSEGFDVPALTTLYICTPIKFSGRLIQAVGRVLRPSPGKDKALVVDFVDARVGVLKAAARARQRVYQEHMERAS